MDHPKVKKIIRHCERRVKKLTGNSAILIMFLKPAKILPFDDIIKLVCDTTGEPYDKILKRGRKTEVVVTRQLICFYAKQYCGLSHKRIANGLGYDDHTTSIHSIQNIKDLIESGDSYVTSLVSKINQQLTLLNDRPSTTRTPDGDSGAGQEHPARL